MSPSIAGPSAPSAAPPPSVRSMWSADQVSDAFSEKNATSTIAPPQNTIALGNGPATAGASATSSARIRISAVAPSVTAASMAKCGTGPIPASRASPVASAEAA